MAISVKKALNYLNKGFSVFPVIITKDEHGKIQKKPAVPWRDYINRLPTREEITDWFSKKEYNGIGVATGGISGIVVIDVEAEAEPETVEKYRSPLSARTISGGWHFYFKASEELRNTVRIDNKLVDFRGDGGFIVLPPSGLEDKSYSWDSAIPLTDLPPLPYDIVKQLQKRSTPTSEPVFDFNGKYPYPEGYEGSRNDTLTSVTGSILKRLPKEQWDVMGWATIVDWNERHCHPPMDEREVRQTWESIKSKEKESLSVNRDLDKYKIFTGSQAINEYRRMEAKFGDGLTTGYPELDQMFTLLPQQVILISAPTHQGKTTFALNIAAKVATFGHRVLFASLEQGIFIAPRVETILKEKFPDSLGILVSNELLTIPGIIKVIETMEKRPELVVIDHLHFVEKSKNKGTTDAMDEMMLQIQNMAKKLDLPVIVIAHMRKLNADRSPELDDLRDSSSLQQVPSVVLLMHRKKNNSGLQDSYLEKNGKLYVAKNRIKGKTGSLYFIIEDSGEVKFDQKYKPKDIDIQPYVPKSGQYSAPRYQPYRDS